MRMTARPQNVHQARLLRLLRDEGPRSRAELGDVVRLSRSKLAVELDRLVALGLVEAAGLAASRGGRRSGIVRLSPRLRFVAFDIGATSIDVAVNNGELEVLGHVSEPCAVREGATVVLERSLELLGKLRDQGLIPQVDGTGIGVPGSSPWVAALNCLQNSMMLTPRWPSAGPMGGDGLACPAGHCSLT